MASGGKMIQVKQRAHIVFLLDGNALCFAILFFLIARSRTD